MAPKPKKKLVLQRVEKPAIAPQIPKEYTAPRIPRTPTKRVDLTEPIALLGALHRTLGRRKMNGKVTIMAEIMLIKEMLESI